MCFATVHSATPVSKKKKKTLTKLQTYLNVTFFSHMKKEIKGL